MRRVRGVLRLQEMEVKVKHKLREWTKIWEVKYEYEEAWMDLSLDL